MNSIERSRMHIDHAKLILEEKALKKYGLFYNRRYVKMAGRVAYKGLVIALNDLLGIKGQKEMPDDVYQNALYKCDRRMVRTFVLANYVLDSAMRYYGCQSAKYVSLGLNAANHLITRIEKIQKRRLEKSVIKKVQHINDRTNFPAT